MKKYKFTLRKGVALFDPKTRLHFKFHKDFEIVTEEFIEKNDMSGIEYNVRCGVLTRTLIEETKEPVVKEEDNITETEIDPGKELIEEESEIKTQTEDNTEEVVEEEVQAEKVVETEEEDNAEEEIEEVEEESAEDKVCQGVTKSGSSCSNKATYPEEDPQYCWMHKDDSKE